MYTMGVYGIPSFVCWCQYISECYSIKYGKPYYYIVHSPLFAKQFAHLFDILCTTFRSNCATQPTSTQGQVNYYSLSGVET